MALIEFGYWNLRGYMQPIRLMCEDLEVKWTEKKYDLVIENGVPDKSEWLKEKENLGLRFPNLPYMIDRDSNIRLTESSAIIRYLARKFMPSMLGKTPEDAAMLDMFYGVISDLRQKGGKIYYGPESEFEAGLEIAREAARSVLPKLMEGCKPFLIGDYITYVDYICYEVLDNFKELMPKVFQEEGLKPCLKYMEMFEAMKLRSQCPNPVHKMAN